jgi:hypothetical protein
MFNLTKYTKIYFQIVNRAKNTIRENEIYYENHHIIPKSLGGSNKVENIVKLTAREHFICHWLLTKMVSELNRHKMIYALNMMRATSRNHNNCRYRTKITARVYEKYKIECAKNSSKMNAGRVPANKGKKLEGEELRCQQERIKNRRKLTPEENAIRIAKMVASRKGSKLSDETKNKISQSLTGKKKGPMNDSEKLKRSESLIGRKKDPSSVAKRTNTLKSQVRNGVHHTQIKLTCPHCGIEMVKLLYSRYHGSKCKFQ